MVTVSNSPTSYYMQPCPVSSENGDGALFVKNGLSSYLSRIRPSRVFTNPFFTTKDVNGGQVSLVKEMGKAMRKNIAIEHFVIAAREGGRISKRKKSTFPIIIAARIMTVGGANTIVQAEKIKVAFPASLMKTKPSIFSMRA